jgi:hypothetical protein
MRRGSALCVPREIGCIESNLENTEYDVNPSRSPKSPRDVPSRAMTVLMLRYIHYRLAQCGGRVILSKIQSDQGRPHGGGASDRVLSSTNEQEKATTRDELLDVRIGINK